MKIKFIRVWNGTGNEIKKKKFLSTSILHGMKIEFEAHQTVVVEGQGGFLP